MLPIDDFPSFHDLLKAVGAGDECAQESFYEKFATPFLRDINHLLRLKGCANSEQDGPGVLSSVCRKVFQYLHKLRNEDSFIPWTKEIIRNEVNAHLAYCIKKQKELPADDYQNQPAVIATPDEVILCAERLAQVMALAATIHPKLPDILYCRLEDMRFDEIAVLVDESYGNVRTIYSRGLKRIRSILSDQAAMARPGL